MNSIGERLKEKRTKCGYKQQQLSGMLGLSINAYGSYEQNNSTPSTSRFIRLAEILHTTVHYLITGEELPADEWAAESTPFPERLKALRAGIGFTQDATAKALGIWLRTYQKYEYGGFEPKLDKLEILTELFDVSYDELMGRNHES